MTHPARRRHDGPTVAQLYISAFRRAPGAVAIQAPEEAITYGELEKRAWRCAREFLDMGLKRQDTLAFLVGNRVEALVALIAAQLAGLRCMSLHPMASEEDHCFILADAGADALVVDTGRFAARARAIHERGAVPKVVQLDDVDGEPGLHARARRHDDAPMPLPDDPGEITKLSYTGGTTGRSKGILHAHRTTVTSAISMLAAYDWPREIRYLAATPISHAAGAIVLPVFMKGGTVFLMEKYEARAFLEIVREQRITLAFLVPTQIYGLLDEPDFNRQGCASLGLVLYGASPIAPSRLAQAIERIGPVFGQLYGQAEAPMTLTYLSQADHDLSRPELLASCGRVIPGNQVALLDKDLREVPVGEVGEICARGPLLMEGYLNRPEEDEKVFAGGWLHTGDMARMDAQGYLYIVDRAKDMIISGGFNVYPSEVENCLALHPQVAVSSVIGTPDEKWGERVTAVVVLKAGARCTEEELIRHVVERKGVVNAPKRVVFEPELPLTALGKIDKKALKARYWTGNDRSIN
ncbi:AMP-binding protein [Achromobacter aloeverae]